MPAGGEQKAEGLQNRYFRFMKEDWKCSSEVEHLLCTCEVLGLIPGTTKQTSNRLMKEKNLETIVLSKTQTKKYIVHLFS